MMGVGSASFILRKANQPKHHAVFNSQCVNSTVCRLTPFYGDERNDNEANHLVPAESRQALS